MELVRVSRVEAGGRVRLVGEVAYDDRGLRPEEYWFEAPASCASDLSDSGNPWLVALVALAATLNEPLRLCRPVDGVLLANIRQLMRVWRRWYPHLHEVRIEADSAPRPAGGGPSRTVAFFSGGVDSFFTTLHYDVSARCAGRRPIEELLWIWGFDIPLANPEAAGRMRASLRAAAGDLGKAFTDVTTNVRGTRLERAGWGYVYHGCALAAAALALENRYATALISSHEAATHWGTNPLVDPLFSTGRTSFVHYGSDFSRSEKTEWIDGCEAVMRTLHVCWRSWSDVNCGRCEKCYRTMIALETIGALRRYPTFPPGSFSVANIPRVYSTAQHYPQVYRNLQSFARARGRKDIARAIDKSLKRSRRLDRWWALRGRLARWLGRTPALQRLADRVEKRLAEGTMF